MKYTNIYRIGLYLLFLILPLFVFSWSDDSYILPKWVLLELATLLLATILILPGVRNHKQPIIIPNSVCIPFFLLVSLNALSFFYAESKTLAIHQLTQWTFLFLLYITIIRLLRIPLHLYYLLSCLLISAGITSLWVVLQDLHLLDGGLIARLPDWRGYLVGGMGNSDYVAGFLAGITPLAVALYYTVSKNRYRWFLLLLIILCYAALIVTWSVGSNGGLIIGLLFMAILLFMTRNKRTAKQIPANFLKITSILLVCLLLVTLFYVLPNPLNGRGVSIFQQAFGSHRWKEGGNTRLVIWLNTLELIKAHPIIGIGTGNFTFRYLDSVSPKVMANPAYKIYAGEYTNAAHNEILQTWTELGILGVILLILLFYQYFKLSLVILRKCSDSDPITRGIILGSMGGTSALCIYGMMSYPFHLPATCLVFLILLGIPTIISQNIITDIINLSEMESKKTHLPTPSWFRILRLVSGLILFIGLSVWIVCPLIADTYFKQGKFEKQYGNIPEAMNDFEQAALWADHADAEYNLGDLLFQQGRLPEALSYYLQASKQRKDKYIYNGLANVYYFQGQPQKSIYYLQILTERIPDNPIYWKFLWMAASKSQNQVLAEKAHLNYEKLRNQFPD